MKKNLAVLWILVWLVVPIGVYAQEENRAGLVVLHEDGRVETVCVAFSEATITGSELLTRSNLFVERDVTGMGELVCRIGETGCPSSDCFCQCQGGDDCVYWSYWQQAEAGWRYSQGGATRVEVTDGTVQAWVWGPGSADEAPEPPPITLAEICAVPTVMPSATPVLATLPPATALAQAQGTATAAALLFTPTPIPPPTTATSATPWAYLGFVALLLGLAGVFVFTRRRDS